MGLMVLVIDDNTLNKPKINVMTIPEYSGVSLFREDESPSADSETDSSKATIQVLVTSLTECRFVNL